MNLAKTLIVAALSATVGALSAITITLFLLDQTPQQVTDADATPSPNSSFIISPSPSPSPSPIPTPRPSPTPDLAALRSLLTLEMQNHISGLLNIFSMRNPSSFGLRITQAGKFFVVEYSFHKDENNYSNTAAVSLSYIAQCKYRIEKGADDSVLQFAGSEIEHSYPNPDWSPNTGWGNGITLPEVLWITTQGQTIVDGVRLCPDYIR